MRYPNVWTLHRPKYVFGDNQTFADKLRGLTKYQPMKPVHVRAPHCLFIFMEHDRERANKLYLALRNGIGSFPGCNRLVGVTLDRPQAERLLIRRRDGHQAQEHYETITRRLE